MIAKNQKISPISINQKIDYKDIDLLSLFLTEQGKILPRRATGVTVQQQRKLTKAIKRARIVSLLPVAQYAFGVVHLSNDYPCQFGSGSIPPDFPQPHHF